jgi:hypothetical protein
MRAALDWSYVTLTEQEQTVLRHLSIFPGNFTLQAACHILSDSNVGPITDQIIKLIAKSLVAAETSELEPRLCECYTRIRARQARGKRSIACGYSKAFEMVPRSPTAPISGIEPGLIDAENRAARAAPIAATFAFERAFNDARGFARGLNSRLLRIDRAFERVTCERVDRLSGRLPKQRSASKADWIQIDTSLELGATGRISSCSGAMARCPLQGMAPLCR